MISQKRDDSETLSAKIRELGPWFHQIEIAPGIRTREIAPSPGPQGLDHPQSRWRVFKDRIPFDLSGIKVLDIGSADGFFTIELARRGATVLAQDAAPGMIRRLEWAAGALGLSDRIKTRIGTVECLPTDERYDFVLFLGLLYHLRHPFVDLERICQVSDLIYLESAVHAGGEPYLFLKPPQPGVHQIPKWFPTASCVREMLKLLQFSEIEDLNDPTRDRLSLIARRL